MKVLMIRWKSIVEPDIMEAFENEGHEIVVWDGKIINADYDKEAVVALSDTLLTDDFDIVFTIDYFPIVARICNACRIKYVSWSVDCPVFQYYSKTISSEYNRIFMFDYAMYREFYPYNTDHIYYLPLGVNLSHNDKVIASITDEDRKKYSADISFIGSTYAEKCKFNEIKDKLSDWTRGFSEALIDTQLLIYGGSILKEACSAEYLERILNELEINTVSEDYRQEDVAFISQFYLGEKASEQERLRLLKRLSEKFSVDMYTMSDVSSMPHINYKGSAESRVEMPKIFHLSKINLNITSKTIQTGLPQRFWDVLGAGGFLLSNMQSEIAEYLTPGVDLEIYSSFEECEDKISYYLSHEKKRMQIAKNGYEKVKKLYTYEHRISQMVKILEEELWIIPK